MGTFGYSDQDGAGAYSREESTCLVDRVPSCKRLMQIQQQISKKRKKALIGNRFDLLL